MSLLSKRVCALSAERKKNGFRDFMLRLPSVRCNVDLLKQAGPRIERNQALITSRGSNMVVLIEAGGFYSRIYGISAVGTRYIARAGLTL